MASMIPSMTIELLRRLTSKPVSKLVRYSWWPASEVSVQFGIEDGRCSGIQRSGAGGFTG